MMSDLISRQAVNGIIDEIYDSNLQATPAIWYAFHQIKNLPSVQPEIIRCRDCIYYSGPWYCEYWNNSPGFPEVKEDGFCNAAERKRRIAMTLQEALNTLGNLSLIISGCDEEKIKEAFSVIERYKWVPTSERLPERSGMYFVTKRQANGAIQMAVGSYYALTKEWSENGNFKDVIAWMKLPSPYEP